MKKRRSCFGETSETVRETVRYSVVYFVAATRQGRLALPNMIEGRVILALRDGSGSRVPLSTRNN